MKRIIRQRAQVLGLSLLATACVSTSLEPGRDHPANAEAKTAPLVAHNAILASAPAREPTTATHTAHAHDQAAPMAGSYSCPMHPEIVKDAPGKCPICGMSLVKKEAAPR